MALAFLACLSLAVWIYLLIARGRFWQVSRSLPQINTAGLPARRVAIIIPARNEAESIGQTITSLLKQDFPSPIHIFLVDDSSTDGTADAARAAANHAGMSERLTIIRAAPLPPGWTGKMWAVSQGIAPALANNPDYLLLTDADIVHGSRTMSQLVSIAETGAYDLASYMALLACRTPAEKALIPAFVFFFLMLYPPAWISSAKSRIAGAAGGCILVRPAALARAGGIEAIRSQVIDDCALAAAVKRSSGRIWLGLTREARSIRSYETFAEVERMIARTAFNQLRHSAWLLAGTAVGLGITYLAPPLLLLSGRSAPAALGAIAWALMASAYLPMVRFYKQSPLWAIALPAIAAFYTFATIHSALRYWRGTGGTWKGRVQDSPKAT